MSSGATATPDPAATPATDKSAGAMPPQRGFFARLAIDVLGRWGARIGLAWIAILVLLAVFAPLLASSHPVLWRVDGETSSPLLRHLTATDVTLLIAFFAAAVLACLYRVPAPARIAAWVWLVAWTVPFASYGQVQRWMRGMGDDAVWPWVVVGMGVFALVALLVAVAIASRATPGFKAGIAVAALLVTVLLITFPINPPTTQVLSQYREAHAAGSVEWSIHTPIPFSPNDRQRDRLAMQEADPRLLPPDRQHLMGTTDEGADLASRMIHASRIALSIGLIATGIAVVIGVIVGGLMGYFSGWVDLIGMRLVEVFSAIPVIFLLIMIVAFYGRSLYLMMVVIGLTGWVGYAIFIRAEFLKLRSMDYVQAARAVGVPLWSILFRHMLPNGITPVLVLASFGIASAIITESTLSFLGLGLVEEPSWGQMLNQARAAGSHWGLVIFPGLAIFLTVFAYNLVGEAMRDALDPRTQRR
jgi:peptide/nickel transport system permease protein